MDAFLTWLSGTLPFGVEWLQLELLLKLLLAVFLGGAIGWDRESSGKPAGLRTNILICLGATLLTDVSIRMPLLAPDLAEITVSDPARIAAQIVSGIGFLGAGTIIQARGSVIGLTTAATLWVGAAIGIAIGAEAYMGAVGATALVLVILLPMQWMERKIAEDRTERELELTVRPEEGAVDRILNRLRDAGLEVRSRSVSKPPDQPWIVVRCTVRGDTAHYRRIREELLTDPEVAGFSSE